MRKVFGSRVVRQERRVLSWPTLAGASKVATPPPPRMNGRPSTPWKRSARGPRPAVRTALEAACADLGFPAARLRHSVGQTERSRRAHLPSASEPGKTWRFPKCAVATVAVPRSSLPHLRFSATTCLFVCLRRVFRRATGLGAAAVVGLSSLAARTFASG